MPENRVRFRADLDDKVSGKLDKLRDNFDRLGKTGGFKSLVQGVGVGAGVAATNLLAGAVSGLGDLVGDSIDKASALNETVSKGHVIFGQSAKDIEQWSEGTAEHFGIAKRAAIDAAASFGGFFEGAGTSAAKAAGMSKRLVELSADLASFYDLEPGDVLEKLQSGLAGEAEPLRKLNVFLSDAKVKAKAMEMGIGDVHHELTEGEKILVRYQLILDSTKAAQGDYARTADSLANSQRSLNARYEEAQTTLGEKMLPIQLEATRRGIDVFTGLNTIADVMGHKVTPESLALANAFHLISDEQLVAGLRSLEMWKKLNDVGGAMDDVRQAAGKADPAIGDVGDATGDAGDEADKATRKFKTFAETLLEEANAIIAGYYDPIEARAKIAQNNADIRAAKRKLQSKDLSSQEIRDLNATVEAAERSNDELSIELLATGKLSDKEKKKWIDDLDKRSRDGTAATKRYIAGLRREIERLDGTTANINIIARTFGGAFGVGGTGTGPPSKSGLASGGYAGPGWSGWVGEEGPERMHVLRGGGVVVEPNRGGGGGATVVFNTIWPPSPEQARAIAEVVDRQLSYQAARTPQTRFVA